MSSAHLFAIPVRCWEVGFRPLARKTGNATTLLGDAVCVEDHLRPTEFKVMQNPPWTEEELVLAYWVYICRGPARFRVIDPRVRRLSEVLIELPIHPQDQRLASFRTPDGVRRRLSYLQAIDRGDDVAGHAAYRKVVETYRERPDDLEKRAQEILASYGVRW